MSDTWSDIQAVKNRTSSLRAKMAARRKEREGLVAEITNTSGATSSAGNIATLETTVTTEATPSPSKVPAHKITSKESPISTVSTNTTTSSVKISTPREVDPEIEKRVLLVLCDISMDIPCNASVIADHTSRMMGRDVSVSLIEDLLRKFEAQQLISITMGDSNTQEKSKLVVSTLDISKLSAVTSDEKVQKKKRKRESGSEGDQNEEPASKQTKQTTSSKEDNSIESLLSMQSAKEKESKKLSDEIQDLLTKPTAKEQILVQRFKSQGGAQLKEFCQYGTKEECKKFTGTKDQQCKKLHFRKIIHKHTDESLGDCSFLNTCFHMDTCKYVHYEIDYPAQSSTEMLKKEAMLAKKVTETNTSGDSQVCMYPPQWIQCDLRSFAMSTLGKCAVVMADPPWDIHMELPYGTMSDDEMRKLDVPGLQDDGFIFLWVTGRCQCGNCMIMPTALECTCCKEIPQVARKIEELDDNLACICDHPGFSSVCLDPYVLETAYYQYRQQYGERQTTIQQAMELGRECLELWGYKRVDELIWVKTNQLQRIIRTGRTGHWLNHGKEHCLVGVKGNPKGVNKGLDCDVIVAEVRATSHKPDEVYGIIERLSPGTRKVELFGRPHNVQPNWITLGNQLEGVRLKDPDIVKRFKAKYPDGNCMEAPKSR